MVRSTALRRRRWEDGPPPVFGIALRILLVIGVFKLIALSAGGAFFFAPWLLIPLVFMLVGGGLFRSRRYGHGWGHGHGRDEEDLPPSADARPLSAAGSTPEALEREYRLEAELATAQRQIRDLQEQLSWQGRLLKTAAVPPPAGEAPAAPPAAAPPPAGADDTVPAPPAPRQSPAGGPDPV
jgi:hypothetical protein